MESKSFDSFEAKLVEFKAKWDSKFETIDKEYKARQRKINKLVSEQMAVDNEKFVSRSKSNRKKHQERASLLTLKARLNKTVSI